MCSFFYIYSRYVIDKLDTTNQFDLDLSVQVCIDDTCTEVPILLDVKVPIPFCNGSLSLPGDGSINGYVKTIAGQAGQDAINAVLQNFGLEVR